jgi:hypothetical protein
MHVTKLLSDARIDEVTLSVIHDQIFHIDWPDSSPKNPHSFSFSVVLDRLSVSVEACFLAFLRRSAHLFFTVFEAIRPNSAVSSSFQHA